ncbi:MAG: hypothetical protein LBE57_03990 [Methanosarcinales archaeon]|jgi:hypothetical protein|nr:hypothetical protein [Methanosarcinales archaeon]
MIFSENMVKKSILIWFLIIPLAFLNGALRETFLIPWIGESGAELVSAITLCSLILIISFVFIPRIGKGEKAAKEKKTYWKIGVLWIALTIIFETILVLVMGYSFSEVLKTYDITAGNLWLLVVLFMGAAPWLAAKMRKLI